LIYKKIKVYHFHNGTGGGVLSVIKNLLLFKQHDGIENHIIYTINKDVSSDFVIPLVSGAASQQVFYYSAHWNFYHTCNKLSRLFPTDAVIIAHDWLELGLVSNLGLKNKVIHFLHGDYQYYFDLAIRHQLFIDNYICVSNSIKTKLEKFINSESIYYLRFPVKNITPNNISKKISSVVFIGRGEKAKGYHLLPEIAKLIDQKLKIKWEIFGDISMECKDVQWQSSIEVNFHGNVNNEKIINQVSNYDYFILPSQAEGMPVSLIEAMKAGLIPLVNDIEGGIQELVVNDNTGYKIELNNINNFAERVIELESNALLKLNMRSNCISLANDLFNPVANTNEIEKKIIEVQNTNRTSKESKKIYGSRLDQKWIPNFITYKIRKYIFKKN
jgi:glycosyltransferase involved in cell wall biosynthesis